MTKKLKIVLAPNALKGSLSAQAAGLAMKLGIERATPNAQLITTAIADGGDGFAAILADTLQAQRQQIRVRGPLEGSVKAPLYISKNKSIAIIEMAAIAGISLVPFEKRNPLLTSTYGVGEAIKYALDAGVKRIIIGVGGSATNDAGIGMASALGVRFLDSSGSLVEPIGKSLALIQSIDTRLLDRRLSHTCIDVASDVSNLLFGDHGAACVFAPQKGATPEQVDSLDQGLRHFSGVVASCLDTDIANFPGAGAAGGLGGALKVFCNATIQQGVELVLDALDFNKMLENTDLVLTTEGRFDSQTTYGKAPMGVAKRAQQMNVPCIVLAGSVEFCSELPSQTNIAAAISICPGPVSLDSSIQQAFEYLANTAEQVVRVFLAGRQTKT